MVAGDIRIAGGAELCTPLPGHGRDASPAHARAAGVPHHRSGQPGRWCSCCSPPAARRAGTPVLGKAERPFAGMGQQAFSAVPLRLPGGVFRLIETLVSATRSCRCPTRHQGGGADRGQSRGAVDATVEGGASYDAAGTWAVVGAPTIRRSCSCSAPVDHRYRGADTPPRALRRSCQAGVAGAVPGDGAAIVLSSATRT